MKDKETRRILKWAVPVDGKYHVIGSGRVALVACQQPRVVSVWTDEVGEAGPWAAKAYGTGHPLPVADEHIGSALDAPYVWHVLALTGAQS